MKPKTRLRNVGATLRHYIEITYNRHGTGAALDTEQCAELDEVVLAMDEVDKLIASQQQRLNRLEDKLRFAVMTDEPEEIEQAMARLAKDRENHAKRGGRKKSA